MSFHQYVRNSKVIELKSTDKVEALKECAYAMASALKIRTKKALIDEIMRGEESASTFIGQGIAIPEVRIPALTDEFAIVVGRSISGVRYDAARNALAHIIVLVASNDTESPQQLELLSEIASTFKSDFVREKILASEGAIDIRSILHSYTRQVEASERPEQIISPLLASASNLARDISANAVMVFADAIRDNEFLNLLKVKCPVIVVTSNKSRFDPDHKKISALVQTSSFHTAGHQQVKVGILLALSRNLIERDNTVVCITGNPRLGMFDTLVAVDVAAEYEFFFTANRQILPADVKPEVLERVLSLAGEIAVEGREGKPMGTIFVVGDTNTVNIHIRQLIINPFRGYSEAERNILDPGLDETLKEFAAIDGAFIVTGDGIVLSAGSYLRPAGKAEPKPLPSGFGARHLAAASITAATKALAITVSESTGMVTLFKNGDIMMSLAKPLAMPRLSGERIRDELKM